MSLYVRVNCNFFTHRKTARLRDVLGDAALWLPVRLWAYAAENQPDGIFKHYSAKDLAKLLGYEKDPDAMLEALLEAGFMDRRPLRIHDWADYNGYHGVFAERARKAAAARWQKERSKEKGTDKRGEEQALLEASGKNSTNGNEQKPPLSASLKDAGGKQISGSERQVFNDELKRVLISMREIRQSFSDNQSWPKESVDEYHTLVARKKELKGILRVKY